MPVAAPIPAAEVARLAPVEQAPNGICYATFGDIRVDPADLRRLIETVPAAVAGALGRKAYYFVPLTLTDGPADSPVISDYSPDLEEQAICHRNSSSAGAEMIFISTRLMRDRFALAFEFFINIGHGFVEHAGVSPEFAALAWKQAEQDVKGETSQDAYDARRHALTTGPEGATAKGPVRIDEKAKSEFLEASFSDALAVYLLTLYTDVDYYDLREREYPLLAPRALAERLRKIAELFPAPHGYEFAVRFRRRN
jgi:hypothetical protein